MHEQTFLLEYEIKPIETFLVNGFATFKKGLVFLMRPFTNHYSDGRYIYVLHNQHMILIGMVSPDGRDHDVRESFREDYSDE